MRGLLTKIWTVTKLSIFNVVIVAFAFVVCEGLASTFLFVNEMRHTKPLAERVHTHYDAQLGWVNRPNLSIKDMYGPGVYLKTNAQSFRNNEDFTPAIPAGKIRLICSGDSFTFGYGVDNDHTWCQILTALDRGLETVNMGQGGYGIDQAYLWYKRDGGALAHDIHLFAFITQDFLRMKNAAMFGYDKPVLKLENDALVVTNVPVPPRSFYTPWLTQRLPIIQHLKAVELLRQTFFEKELDQAAGNRQSDDQTRAIALKIFEDLYHLNQTQNSVLVLVYLPTRGDYSGQESEPWRQYVQVEAGKRGIVFIDLVAELRKLPYSEIELAFIPEGAVDYPGAAGHYTARGHEHVANALYEKLRPLLAEGRGARGEGRGAR